MFSFDRFSEEKQLLPSKKFAKGGAISVYSPVCEVTDKEANKNYDGDIYCPEGYAIKIDRAKYGRSTKGFCRGDSDSNINVSRKKQL